MSEIDTVTFMQKNGRGFFCDRTDHTSNIDEVVEFSLELALPKTVLSEMAFHCRTKGQTAPEFIAEVLEGWFE